MEVFYFSHPDWKERIRIYSFFLKKVGDWLINDDTNIYYVYFSGEKGRNMIRKLPVKSQQQINDLINDLIEDGTLIKRK